MTDPSALVATMTTASPGFTFMPRASSSGISIPPGLSSLLPSLTRSGRSGTVLNSFSGSIAVSRMLEVSVKLLNMPPNFTRGE
ncbi:MAG: hypothetical protein ACD_87C00286G0001 [uncultured bacterium]|nr:MAG: hypothetical protein ACD_87C00286G0001 [uncultured bacterium]